MNWYTLQIKHAAGLEVAYVNALTAATALNETKETYRVQGVQVSITARKSLLKEWNHYNRTIAGELI